MIFKTKIISPLVQKWILFKFSHNKMIQQSIVLAQSRKLSVSSRHHRRFHIWKIRPVLLQGRQLFFKIFRDLFWSAKANACSSMLVWLVCAVRAHNRALEHYQVVLWRHTKISHDLPALPSDWSYQNRVINISRLTLMVADPSIFFLVIVLVMLFPKVRLQKFPTYL